MIAATRSGLWNLDDGTEVWRGDVRCLAGGYAGGHDGVMRSDDGGRTWREAGLGGLRVKSLAARGDVVLAGTQPTGLHRSDDGGATWRELRSFPRRGYWLQPASPPFTQGYVAALALDGDTVLAGIEGWRAFRSIDGGVSWRAVGRGFSLDCHALVLAHGNAYEGAGFGVSWSEDGGATWRRVRTGLDRRYVCAIAVDPADAGCWYAAAAPLRRAHGRNARAAVFRWTATRWVRIAGDFPVLPYALACPEPDALAIGLGDGRLFLSGDRGATVRLEAELDGIRALV